MHFHLLSGRSSRYVYTDKQLYK